MHVADAISLSPANAIGEIAMKESGHLSNLSE
jgi:hypothetical protein